MLRVKLKFRIRDYLKKRNTILKHNVRLWLGLTTLTEEVNSNFIHINALEEYIRNEKDIESYVSTQCLKHNITNPEDIKQIIKNQEIKNYLDYNNKLLPDSMKEIPVKIFGEDLKMI